MTLYLIRHGESEGNASGVIQGRLDFGLTGLGRDQAQATADRLAGMGVHHIVTSPLRRAFETASIIAGGVGRPVAADPDLQEYDIGAASGLTGPQLRERFPEIVAEYQKGLLPVFPGEEGREPFTNRVVAALDRLLSLDGTVVAVAHGGVVAAICMHVVGLPKERRGSFEAANCAITEVTRDRAGRMVLVRHNDTCHLDGIVTAVDRG